MTARSPHGRAVDEVLADGEWHTLDELVARCGPMVPPGVALRRAEGGRKAALRYKGLVPGERQYGTRDDAMVVGRRSVIVNVLRLRVGSTVERDGDRYRKVARA